MRMVYVDEGGYTGTDLLNEDQPIFSLAAVLPDAASSDDVRRCFKQFQGSELKHKVLHKCGRRDNELVAAQEILIDRCNGMSFVESKRYALIESFLYDCVASVDKRFEYGTQSFSLLSKTLYTYPQLFGGDELHRVLYSYQDAVRNLEGGLMMFRLIVHGVTNENLRYLTRAIRDWHPRVVFALESDSAPQLQVSGLIALITQLELQLRDPFKIIYDCSVAVDRMQDNIRAFFASHCGLVNVSNDINAEFPFRYFKGLESADSKKTIGLQMADILAGGAVCAARSVLCQRSSSGLDDYGHRILSLYQKASPNRWIYKPNDEYVDISQDVAKILAGIT